jgi:7-cyano-7-deazaguanine synthase
MIRAMRRRATVLLSGGIDSATCVHLLKRDGYDVMGLFVDFGQASSRMERRAVDALTKTLPLSTKIIQVSAAEQFGIGELTGRNAFLIFSALLLGGCRDGLLALGIHAGTPYFDCSPSFIARVGPLVEECTNGRVTVAAPFLHWTKDEVYSLFLSSEIPIIQTYSCEAGGDEPCGSCASCKDRARLECSLNDAL